MIVVPKGAFEKAILVTLGGLYRFITQVYKETGL